MPDPARGKGIPGIYISWKEAQLHSIGVLESKEVGVRRVLHNRAIRKSNACRAGDKAEEANKDNELTGLRHVQHRKSKDPSELGLECAG